MLQPTLPGWKAETIGDDICWMRFGDDGRLYAINPEAGFFGVAPGTGESHQQERHRHPATPTAIFTNVALTDDGDVWWEGLTDEPPAHLTDWKGRDWTPESPEPAAHPNARFTVPGRAVPDRSPPSGKTRRACRSRPSCSAAAAPPRVPLVTEAFDWEHGVFLASNVASEGTAAAENKVGELRRDPFAMLPFCGYNMGDYFGHWLTMRRAAPTRPSCRTSTSSTGSARTTRGKFVWPGFGENSRVLKWIVERLEGKADATDTPIGRVPTKGVAGHRRPGPHRRAARRCCSPSTRRSGARRPP